MRKIDFYKSILKERTTLLILFILMFDFFITNALFIEDAEARHLMLDTFDVGEKGDMMISYGNDIINGASIEEEKDIGTLMLHELGRLRDLNEEAHYVLPNLNIHLTDSSS